MQKLIEKAETRLAIAVHYNTPYEYVCNCLSLWLINTHLVDDQNTINRDLIRYAAANHAYYNMKLFFRCQRAKAAVSGAKRERRYKNFVWRVRFFTYLQGKRSIFAVDQPKCFKINEDVQAENVAAWIARYFYASSSCILSADLSPLLSIGIKQLDALFGCYTRDDAASELSVPKPQLARLFFKRLVDFVGLYSLFFVA